MTVSEGRDLESVLRPCLFYEIGVVNIAHTLYLHPQECLMDYCQKSPFGFPYLQNKLTSVNFIRSTPGMYKLSAIIKGSSDG